MLTIIAAASENGVLGKDGGIPWHLPDDFKRFKELTSGHHIIMGRKTFESFPKPLPNRTHVILTKQKDYIAPDGCVVVNNVLDAINRCPIGEESFIIGGGEIYHKFIQLADKIDLTIVHGEFEGDAFFPKLNKLIWDVETKIHHPIDEKHKYSFTHTIYEKS